MQFTDASKSFGLDPLEPRQLFAGTSRLSEVEANNSVETALFVNLRNRSAAILTGAVSTVRDKDYFRIKVGVNGRMQIGVDNLDNTSVKVRFTDESLNTLSLTTKRGSAYVRAGETYYVKLEANSDEPASYRLKLRIFTSEVPENRLASLQKGVNLPDWFWNLGDDARYAMQNYVTKDDIKLIKQLGFGHVRLPVDMKYFFNESDRFNLDTTYLGELDNAISMIESQGIAVIVCPFGDHQNWLEYGGDLRSNAMAFSWTFAKYLSKFDKDLTFIQTTNEPLGGGAAWQGLQEQLVTTLRSAAPGNTIITATPLYYGTSAEKFGTTGALTELSTYRDTNIVYGLHFYEPFVFTHQGATWAIPGMEYIYGLTYPANVDQTNLIGADLNSQFAGTQYEPVVDLVRYYGFDNWGTARVAERLKVATDWAARNGVPMVMDEFGVYGKNVDDASRYKYLSDVRTIAEAAGAGWTMWDFKSGFGVLTESGEIQYDVLAALNLNAP